MSDLSLRKLGKLLGLAVATLLSITVPVMTLALDQPNSNFSLLTDPFLQLPTATTVNVVWFTEFEGDRHMVKYGQELAEQAIATTTKLSRVKEDPDSQILNPPPQIMKREVWRHEARVINLPPNERVPYQVISSARRQDIASQVFTLASLPEQKSVKVLLTSDHQLMPMVAANLEQVAKTVAPIDAVFLAGDLVNVPDRASEWFDDRRGGAFFPALQGKANYQLATSNKNNTVNTVYKGGEIIQHAPIFTAIGNHEVMGAENKPKLKEQFNQPAPRWVAQEIYHTKAKIVNPGNKPEVKASWIKNNSFNTDTYEEIFSLPQSNPGGKQYYATTFGNIRLISLYVTNVWRSPTLEANEQGRYKESNLDLQEPKNWGYGQHIFGDITKGSTQYEWLKQELASPQYQAAKYKIVMLHHPPHTLGGNIVPPYTKPIPKLDYASEGKLSSRYYDYPIEDDYIIRDLIPLLESAKVQLVYYGHSHLWNRFRSSSGMNFLESSNVGNSYGAHLGQDQRPIPSYSPENYAATGDPNGLEPIVPNVAPLTDSGQALPYIASNDITAFSVLNTETGTVSSYRYDVRTPEVGAIKFDEFELISTGN